MILKHMKKMKAFMCRNCSEQIRVIGDIINVMNFKILFILIGLLLLVNINPVSALKLPEEYGDEQCELIAKDYQREFGGDLIFIQPLKDNGAYDLGAYNGHWLNRAWNKNQGNYYIDYQSQTYLQSVDAIKDWYRMMNDKESKVFNVNQGGVPFALIQYY